MSIPRCTEMLAAAALLLFAATAAASGSEAQFKVHYDRGLSFYSNEQYDEAIKEFQIAYDTIPRPRVLFNLGQAHRNLGNARQALDYYLMYQAREPNPKPGLKSELETYIAQMRKLLAEADAANSREEPSQAPPASPPGASSPSSSAPSPPAPSPPATTAAAAAAPADLFASSPSEARRKAPVYKRAWLWCVVGGVATVAVIAGVSIAVTAAPSTPSNLTVSRPFGLGVF